LVDYIVGCKLCGEYSPSNPQDFQLNKAKKGFNPADGLDAPKTNIDTLVVRDLMNNEKDVRSDKNFYAPVEGPWLISKKTHDRKRYFKPRSG
jgi:hypothetical protein